MLTTPAIVAIIITALARPPARGGSNRASLRPPHIGTRESHPRVIPSPIESCSTRNQEKTNKRTNKNFDNCSPLSPFPSPPLPGSGLRLALTIRTRISRSESQVAAALLGPMSSPRPPRLSLDQVRQDGLVELAAAAAAVSSSGTSTGTMAPPSGPGPGLELDLFSLDLRGLEQQFARAAKMSATQLRTALASAAAAAPAVESGWADEEESSRSVAVAADVLRVQRAAAGCRAALREQGEVVVAIGA